MGKRTQETCSDMISKFKSRIISPTSSCKLTIYSNGNDDYQYVLPQFFPTNLVNYGQVIKIKEGSNVIGKEKRMIYGLTFPKNVDTTNVENLNSILRERIGRLVRRSKTFSKKKRFLFHAITLFQFYWNTIKPIHDGRTPLMEEGLTMHRWSWDDFFNFKLSNLN